MINNPSLGLRHLLGASAFACFAASSGFADTIFTPSVDEFPGYVSASAEQHGDPINPGDTAVIAGEGLIPGQQVTLMRGNTVLTDAPLTVDADGNFSFNINIDAEAAIGLQPIVAIAENPATAKVIDLKVSPDLPISGKDKFDIASKPVTPGLYQVVYSDASDSLYVTASVGRPPIKESKLVKIDPQELMQEGATTPASAPAGEDGSDAGLYAVYGIGVDDANGNLWVSNTRQDTVAVYSQDDLSLVKQFAPGTVNHARDIVIDEANNRAYASATNTDYIRVFDTKTLEELEPIQVESELWGKRFSTMSLDLDEESGTLVTVSLDTPEAAVVDLKTGAVKILPLPGAISATGVAYDPQEKLLFVASQGTDNLLIVDTKSGEVLHDVTTGAGPLNVAFEPHSRLAFVANRGSGTVTVVNTNGEIVANLETDSYPNQLRADGKGNVYMVTKSRSKDNPDAAQIWRISPKS